MAIRSFLAFELPVPMKTVLGRALEAMKKSGLDVRWTALDRIHLTIAFLGDVQEREVAFISDAARLVCSRHSPFNAAIKGSGIFGPPRRPRVLWAGLAGETERMAEFQRELFRAMNPAGVTHDGRPFKPHLTMGRFRSGNPDTAELDRLLKTHGDLRSDECLLDELVLFKSDLKPGGAVYAVLGRMPMAGEERRPDCFRDEMEEE